MKRTAWVILLWWVLTGVASASLENKMGLEKLLYTETHGLTGVWRIGEKWFALDKYFLYQSDDGLKWTRAPEPKFRSASYQFAAASPDRLVILSRVSGTFTVYVVHADGQVAQTFSGQAWEVYLTLAPNGFFIGQREGSLKWRSTDGVTWVEATEYAAVSDDHLWIGNQLFDLAGNTVYKSAGDGLTKVRTLEPPAGSTLATSGLMAIKGRPYVIARVTPPEDPKDKPTVIDLMTPGYRPPDRSRHYAYPADGQGEPIALPETVSRFYQGLDTGAHLVMQVSLKEEPDGDAWISSADGGRTWQSWPGLFKGWGDSTLLAHGGKVYIYDYLYDAQGTVVGLWNPAAPLVSKEIVTTCAGAVDVSTGDICVSRSALAAAGVMSGDPSGRFRPNDGLTRAEIAKMAVMLLKASPDPTAPLSFSDVNGHWAATGGYLQTASRLGLIKGYSDGTFRPDAQVTRAEALVIAIRLAEQLATLPEAQVSSWGGYGVYMDDIDGVWFAEPLAKAFAAGLFGNSLWAPHQIYFSYNYTSEPRLFQGDQPMPRGEAAILFNNLLQMPAEPSYYVGGNK